MSDHNLLMSLEEIEDLLKELEEQTSIIKQSPSSLEEIHNIEQRQKELKRFQLINELYVIPLEHYLNAVNYKNGNYSRAYMDNNDFSISERISRLRNALLRQGCTLEQILSFVPKTVEEVVVLTYAKENGLALNPALSNVEKVANAQKYLDTIGISPFDNNTEHKNRTF